MPLVTVKSKYQVTLPRGLRQQLGIHEGDLLEAVVRDGQIVLIPQQVIDRGAAHARIAAIAQEAEAAWREEGMTDEEMERRILDEVRKVRTERRKNEDDDR